MNSATLNGLPLGPNTSPGSCGRCRQGGEDADRMQSLPSLAVKSRRSLTATIFATRWPSLARSRDTCRLSRSSTTLPSSRRNWERCSRTLVPHRISHDANCPIPSTGAVRYFNGRGDQIAQCHSDGQVYGLRSLALFGHGAMFDLGPLPAICEEILAQGLVRHLENEFQQYRGAKPQAGDSDHEPAGIFVRSENVLQQLRSAVGDLWLVDIS